MTSQKKDPIQRLPAHLCRNPLPSIAQEVLKKAAAIEPEAPVGTSKAPVGTSKARTEALDEAITEIKRRFHQYFRN